MSDNPPWKIDYRECSRCGAVTIMFTHWMTGSHIEVNPLPDLEGVVLPDLITGKCRVVPLKQMKKYPQLWQPHVATCPKLRKEVEQ